MLQLTNKKGESMNEKDYLKNKFTEDILNAIEETKKLGYVPTRFIQMLRRENNDAYELALKIVNKNVTYGLEKLWEKGRLDLTTEAIILKPEYKELFSQEIIDTCEKKLKQFGYKK